MLGLASKAEHDSWKAEINSLKFVTFGLTEKNLIHLKNMAQEWGAEIPNEEHLAKCIVANFDNNIDKQGTSFLGIQTYSPNRLSDSAFAASLPGYFLILAADIVNISKQLELLGVVKYYWISRFDSMTSSYYCQSLAGESLLNLSINSDMTVSCYCHDNLKEGYIGDLNINTLEEILDGEIAVSFRAYLAQGVFPTSLCHTCRDLRQIPAYVAKHKAHNYRLPETIMIENCAACNYSCKYCARRSILASRETIVISKDDMQKISLTLSRCNIKHVEFFKLGEPFLDAEIEEKLMILKEHNPDLFLVTSTNGMLIDSASKIEAAMAFDQMIFSVDGIDTRMLNMYQVGADFDAIMRNVRTLVNAKKERGLIKPELVWKYVVFSWNDSEDAIEKAFTLAKDIGFDKLRFTLGNVQQIWEDRSKRFFYEDFIPPDINGAVIEENNWPNDIVFDL